MLAAMKARRSSGHVNGESMTDLNKTAACAALDSAKAAIRSASPRRVAVPSPNGAERSVAGAGRQPLPGERSIDGKLYRDRCRY
jgi:hypothetical protein